MLSAFLPWLYQDRSRREIANDATLRNVAAAAFI
jgi:hypothetical protein